MSTIIGLACSLRSKIDEKWVEKVCKEEIKTDQDLHNLIEILGRDKVISNSDACLIAAMYGVVKEECDIKVIRMSDFHPSILDSLIFRGVIVSTPVYFGDNSSYSKKFFYKMRDLKLLNSKVFSVLSVGAKRNGGQETSNIFSLYEALSQGCRLVGNGFAISQYGGTAWAGDLGSVREDTYGIETSLSTGMNNARVSNLFIERSFNIKEKTKLNITFLNTKNSNIYSFVDKLQNLIPKNLIDLYVSYIDISRYYISPCKACSVCPKPNSKIDYKCRQIDENKEICERLVNSDLIVKVNDHDIDFDIFMERTRHLRRDNYRLSHIPFVTYIDKQCDSSFVVINDFTKFIRHNVIIFPPLITTNYKNQTLKGNDTDEYYVRKMLDYIAEALRIKKNKIENKSTFEYKPIGYKQKG